jgi:anti-anti-sigma factor
MNPVAAPPHAVAPHAITLRLSGELDLAGGAHTIARVRGALRRAPRRVDLDLRAIEFIDLGGVSALITCRRMCGARGAELRIVATSPAVRRLLELTGLEALVGPAPRAPAPMRAAAAA